MKKLDFNHGWTCRPLSWAGKEIPVTLPHDAMRTEDRVPTSLGENNIGWFEGGDYEYKRRFTVPEGLKGEVLILEFESVYHNAEVWINDRLAASRPYGYTNFYVELNPWLREGENELRVIARNADQPNSRWYSGTGIFRPVWLYAGDPERIVLNGLRLETLSVNPARLRATVKTTAPGVVRLELLDGTRTAIRLRAATGAEDTAVFEFDMPEAKLWSVDNPCLYTARAYFRQDWAETSFGIRTLSWTPEKGIALNGERVVLRGACIHHDNGLLGACTYPEVEERRIRILKEAGYNAVRSAHNPASKYQLDACDKLGMLMMDEYVDCWYMHKTEHDYASYVEKWWKEDLKDLVEKDYNHPCVIIYSTGNEVAETAQPRGVALQQEFTDYLHQLDPSRPVTCGINIFFNFLSSMGMGVYSDEKAQKQAEAAAKAAEGSDRRKPKKKAVGSEFFNNMAAKMGCDFMKFGASLPPSDWKTKKAFAAMDIAGYNYGNRRYRKDAKKYPKRLILGSETLIGDAYDFWETAKEVPQVVGDFVWAGWDYSGECGLGGPELASYQSDRPEDMIRGGTCRVDATGKKTPEVDYTRVAFELDRGPFLAVFPACEKEKPAITGWQLTRAMRSWTWPGCDGQKTDVEVYARAAAAEILVNGESAGKQELSQGRTVFKDVTYRSGELTAVAYDAAGKELGRDTLKTAGPELELRLEPETKTCRPGEMVFFRIRYTDTEGQTQSMARKAVSVSAENGRVMGAANASKCFRGNFAQHWTPTFFGEAQTVVQAGAPGVLRVEITDGVRSASAELECRA